MWWTSQFSKWYLKRDLIEEYHVNCHFDCFRFPSYLLRDGHIIGHHFCFFLLFLREGSNVGAKDCVRIVYVDGSNWTVLQHITTYHVLEICSWWASHHVVCIYCLLCFLDFPFCEALFFLNSYHKRDITLLSVGFAFVIVQSTFAPSKMDPFVGYMDGENIPNVIVRDIVPVLDLCIGQDVCQSIFI